MWVWCGWTLKAPNTGRIRPTIATSSINSFLAVNRPTSSAASTPRPPNGPPSWAPGLAVPPSPSGMLTVRATHAPTTIFHFHLPRSPLASLLLPLSVVVLLMAHLTPALLKLTSPLLFFVHYLPQTTTLPPSRTSAPSAAGASLPSSSIRYARQLLGSTLQQTDQRDTDLAFLLLFFFPGRHHPMRRWRGPLMVPLSTDWAWAIQPSMQVAGRSPGMSQRPAELFFDCFAPCSLLTLYNGAHSRSTLRRGFSVEMIYGDMGSSGALSGARSID